MSTATTRKAAISVQPFLWRTTEEVTKAIQRTAELNLRDLRVELFPSAATPHVKIESLYSAFQATMGIAQFMQTVCDTDYTICVKPVELSSRSGPYTWKHAVILVGVKHRDGHETFIFGEVNDEPMPPELMSTMRQHCRALGAERRTPDAPNDLLPEINRLYQVIASSVEQLLRRKGTALN